MYTNNSASAGFVDIWSKNLVTNLVPQHRGTIYIYMYVYIYIYIWYMYIYSSANKSGIRSTNYTNMWQQPNTPISCTLSVQRDHKTLTSLQFCHKVCVSNYRNEISTWIYPACFVLVCIILGIQRTSNYTHLWYHAGRETVHKGWSRIYGCPISRLLTKFYQNHACCVRRHANHRLKDPRKLDKKPRQPPAPMRFSCSHVWPMGCWGNIRRGRLVRQMTP